MVFNDGMPNTTLSVVDVNLNGRSGVEALHRAAVLFLDDYCAHIAVTLHLGEPKRFILLLDEARGQNLRRSAGEHTVQMIDAVVECCISCQSACVGISDADVLESIVEVVGDARIYVVPVKLGTVAIWVYVVEKRLIVAP